MNKKAVSQKTKKTKKKGEQESKTFSGDLFLIQNIFLEKYFLTSF